MTRLAAVVIGAVIAASPRIARAADHDNLEEGAPTHLADAYSAAYLERQVFGILRYERNALGSDDLVFEPRLEVGVPRNGQIALHAPIVLDDVEEVRWGNWELEGFYNLNQESLVVPALALGGGLEVPSGGEGRGVDPYLLGALSKHVPGTSFWNGVHANLTWQANTLPEDGEREHRYEVVVGWAFRISAGTIALVDGVRELAMKEDEETHLAEIGLRTQLTPLLVGSLGAGLGGSEGELVGRGTVAVQYYAF